MSKIFCFYLIMVLFFLSTIQAQTKRIESDKKQSTITYQLTHPLHEVEAVSKDASCWLDVDETQKQIKRAFVQVAVTSFNSGNSNRDSHAMEVVDALTYPDVRFTSTSITQQGDSLKIAGRLTFHGVTKDITINAAENWANNKLIVNGKFDISLTAFKIERPSLMMIPVKDDLKFTFTEAFNL